MASLGILPRKNIFNFSYLSNRESSSFSSTLLKPSRLAYSCTPPLIRLVTISIYTALVLQFSVLLVPNTISSITTCRDNISSFQSDGQCAFSPPLLPSASTHSGSARTSGDNTHCREALLPLRTLLSLYRSQSRTSLGVKVGAVPVHHALCSRSFSSKVYNFELSLT